MIVHWAEATVVDIEREEDGVQYVNVRRRNTDKVEKAIHYTDAQLPLEAGDDVILNTTAVDLSLGSGGHHFVAWKLSAELPPHEPKSGHIMKLRYTPWQFAVMSAEEQASHFHDVLKHASHVDAMPVLVGELHSMLPILVASLRHIARESGCDVRIAYIMTDGAALPIKLSRHVKWLQEHGWIVGTVTAGHAYGGDLEAVNIYSGLLMAKYVLQADITIVLMGPGIVGTGTAYGFTGVEQGQIVNAVHTLGGVPVVVPRISFADRRERHRGISHHTLTNLSRVIMCSARVALPELKKKEWQDHIEKQVAKVHGEHEWVRMPLTTSEIKNRLCDYPHNITSMGRRLEDDPSFFLAVSCSADIAWAELQQNEDRHHAEDGTVTVRLGIDNSMDGAGSSSGSQRQ